MEAAAPGVMIAGVKLVEAEEGSRVGMMVLVEVVLVGLMELVEEAEAEDVELVGVLVLAELPEAALRPVGRRGPRRRSAAVVGDRLVDASWAWTE